MSESEELLYAIVSHVDREGELDSWNKEEALKLIAAHDKTVRHAALEMAAKERASYVLCEARWWHHALYNPQKFDMTVCDARLCELEAPVAENG